MVKRCPILKVKSSCFKREFSTELELGSLPIVKIKITHHLGDFKLNLSAKGFQFNYTLNYTKKNPLAVFINV